MMAPSYVNFVLFIIWSIVVLCTGQTIGYGWSQWFGNNGSTGDQLFTLQSSQNTAIIRVCGAFTTSQYSTSVFYGITAYFSDNHAATGGGGGKRICLDALSEGQCFASIYVNYHATTVDGLQLSTSDNIHLPYLGTYSTTASAGTASAINLCLSGIQVYWVPNMISGIRFHFSATDDWMHQTTDGTEQPVQISNKQTSSTQVSSVTKQEQPVIVNINSENNDSSASTIAFIVIFMIICMCLFVICYKVWGTRYQGMRNMVEFVSCCKNSTAVIDDNHIWLKQWLTDTVCLEQYYTHFVVNGYEREEFVKDIEKVTELETMGIVKQGHQKHILQEIQKLGSKHNSIDPIDLELENENGKKTNENADHLYQAVEHEIIVN